MNFIISVSSKVFTDVKKNLKTLESYGEFSEVDDDDLINFLAPKKKLAVGVILDADPSDTQQVLLSEMGIPYFVYSTSFSVDNSEFVTFKNKVESLKSSLNDDFEMISGFIDETLPMLEEIEGLILNLESSADKKNILATYFRLLHTIKGTAACLGLTHLAEFTHQYEDFVSKITKGEIEVDELSINVLLKGFDGLKSIFNEVVKTFTDEHIDVQPYISEAFSNTETVKKLDQPKKEIVSPEVRTVVQDLVMSAPIIVESKNNSAPTPTSTSTVAASSNSTPASSSQAAEKESDKMYVDMEILDKFMETSGELTVTRGAIEKVVSLLEQKFRGDNDVENLREILSSMHKITGSLQNQITDMRKVPLKNVFRPYKRLVRDLSKTLKKDVDLEIIGDELFVDNIISKCLSSTLIHLVRNSIDHGIESPEERREKSKDAMGKIVLKAEQRGETIIVDIIDDGKGLNYELIKRKALEKGIMSADEISRASNKEIGMLIFHSGFSTAAVVTDVSGRGVGMDMVKSTIDAMGGKIEITSEMHRGAQFSISLPVPKSVMIINSLAAVSGNQSYFISMDDIVEIVKVPSATGVSNLISFDGSKMFEHLGNMYPIIFFDELVTSKKSERSEYDDFYCVIIKYNDFKVALVFDQILEFEEIVMRKIHPSLNEKSLFTGASINGAGIVSLIISAEGVAKSINYHKQAKGFVTEEKEAVIETFSEYMTFTLSDELVYGIDLNYVFRLESVDVKNINKTGENFVVKYRDSMMHLIDLNQRICGIPTPPESDLVNVIVVHYENRYFGFVVADIQEITLGNISDGSDQLAGEFIEGCVYDKNHYLSILSHAKIIKKFSTQIHKLSSVQKIAA